MLRPDEVPDRLARDLRKVFGPSVPVPEPVDRGLAARARKSVGRNRWVSVRRIATLAAAVLLTFALGHRVLMTDRAAPGDFDGSGRVDILDAYRLALQLERGESPAPVWDLDGDGIVDLGDVTAIARRAVSISGRGAP